jgi:hypothetical protein
MNTLYLWPPSGRLLRLPFATPQDAQAWLSMLESRGRRFNRAVWMGNGILAVLRRPE